MDGRITKFIFYFQKKALQFQNVFFWNAIVKYLLFKKINLLSSLYFLTKIVLQWLSYKPKHIAMLYNKAIWFSDEDLFWTVLPSFLILKSLVSAYMKHEIPWLFTHSDDEK